MIINCGRRRIKPDRFNWTVERLSDEGNWIPDRPAYPASLAQALQMILERTLCDRDEGIDVKDLPRALQAAYREVLTYTRKARAAA